MKNLSRNMILFHLIGISCILCLIWIGIAMLWMDSLIQEEDNKLQFVSDISYIYPNEPWPGGVIIGRKPLTDEELSNIKLYYDTNGEEGSLPEYAKLFNE